VFWVRIAPLMDKHVLCTIALVLGGGVHLTGFWLGGASPALENIRVPLLAGAAAVGAFGSGLWVLAPSMLADLAEEHELRTNEQRKARSWEF
jgi:hypothetical protein